MAEMKRRKVVGLNPTAPFAAVICNSNFKLTIYIWPSECRNTCFYGNVKGAVNK